MTVFFRYLLLALFGLTSLFSVTAYLGDWGEFFDTTSHFVLLYLGIELLAFVIFALKKQAKWACAAQLFFVLNLIQVLPFYTHSHVGLNELGNKIRILQWNTWASNSHPEQIANVINDTQPDFIALEEISSQNYRFLLNDKVMKRYPYHVWHQAGRLVFLSRRPFNTQPILDSNPLSIDVSTKIGSQVLSFVMVHTIRPISGNYQLFLAHMARLNHRLESVQRPLVVMGDLNTGPWSSAFKKLLSQTGLKNTQVGNGILPTYFCVIPKSQIFWPFPILPIDHVLASPELQVLKRWNGPFGGSDHFPVLVELGLNDN